MTIKSQTAEVWLNVSPFTISRRFSMAESSSPLVLSEDIRKTLSQKNLKIKFCPNRDGLGPSTALLYVAEGISRVAQKNGLELEFTTMVDERKAGFNEKTYKKLQARYPNIKKTRVLAKDSIIELEKEGEKIVPLVTAEKMLDYFWKSKKYEESEIHDLKSEGYDAYICMGTPEAHRAAKKEGVLVIEIFDHSWPLSLSRIFNSDKILHPDDWRTKKVKDVIGADERFRDKNWLEKWREKLVYDIITQDIIPQIEKDDREIDYLFMFPEPIAPGEFFCKWCSLAPGKVRRMNGVLGGWKDGEEREQVKKEARQKLSQHWFGKPDKLFSSRIIFIQGGGTPTWDRTLCRMVAQCLYSWGKMVKDTLYLFTKGSVQSLFDPKKTDPSIVQEWGWKEFSDVEKLIDESESVRLVTDVELEKFQMFYAVSDFTFSRPGGITINDNIACRTPNGCVAEPGHWQTEKIREHCVLHHVIRSVDFIAFSEGGIGTVTDQYETKKESNEEMVNIMKTIPNQGEISLAKDILSIIAENLQRKP